jgi:hypothetical protein
MSARNNSTSRAAVVMGEATVARFAAGTFERIAAVLGETKDRTDFIRDAVERELRRREAELDVEARRPRRKR